MLGKDLAAIKAYVSSLQAEKVPSAVSPAVSVVNDDVFKETLTAAFMKNAEIVQPWSTIGVNQWIESGRWWLVLVSARMRVPKAHYGIEPADICEQKGTNGAFRGFGT